MAAMPEAHAVKVFTPRNIRYRRFQSRFQANLEEEKGRAVELGWVPGSCLSLRPFST